MNASRLCECGCGQATPVSEKTSRRDNCVRGQPKRFVHGHNARKQSLAFDERYDNSSRGCWIWGGRTNAKGYGVFGDNLAHRLAYERAKGPIPSGRQIDHLCRTPACVNPAHLEAVAPAVNTRRGLKTKLTEAEVAAIRGSAEATRFLARRYGVTANYVRALRAGHYWQEVTP